MKKALAACALSLFVLAAPGYADDPKPTVEPTVKVDGSSGAHGSGFYIGNGYVVTAAHVPDEEMFIAVVLADGRRLRADVVVSDEIDDLAIVKIDAPNDLRAAPLACRPAVVGEHIEVRGNPLQFDFVSTYGRVAGLARPLLPDWRSTFLIDATIAPGNSGGPVFDKDGAVLGVAVGVPLYRGSILGLGFVVPSTTLCALRDALGLNV